MTTLAPWRSRFSPFHRVTPWSELESLHERLERMMNRGVPGMSTEEPMAWAPAVDLEEGESEFTLTAELAGMSEEDIHLDVEDNVLTLQGEKKTEREEKNGNGRWHLVERTYGTFERSFTLPRAVDTENIEAEFDKGLLTVHIPKRAAASARRISIGEK
jgi:HSP20 family protein